MPRRSSANCRLAFSEREAVMTVAPASASASEMLRPNSGPAPAVTSATRSFSENRSSMATDASLLLLSETELIARIVGEAGLSGNLERIAHPEASRNSGVCRLEARALKISLEEVSNAGRRCWEGDETILVRRLFPDLLFGLGIEQQ